MNSKRKKFFIIIILIFFTSCNMEKEYLDDSVRDKFSINYIKLSNGSVHYNFYGKENKETVVMIHGFSTPSFIWDYTYPDIVKAGFKVITYDLYGRGYSDRPDIKYDENLFDTQLFELLNKLNIAKPVTLIGLSMGGGIAAMFASKHPMRVKKIILIDPASHFQKIPLSAKIVTWPLAGSLLVNLFGDNVILKKIDNNFHNMEKLHNIKEKYKKMMIYKGYKNALISTLKYYNFKNLKEHYQNLGKFQKPIQLFWGQEDKIIDINFSKKIIDLIPEIQFHCIQKAGHIPHYERPEIVNPLIIKFLKSN